MAENKNIEVGGRLHSIATGNVLVGANEIFDDDKNKKQSQINTETYSLVEEVNAKLNTLSPDQQAALDVAGKANNNEVKLGYYVCGTEGNVAAKVIPNITGYVLSVGGSMKVKMTNANTADNATLNINSTGAKALYYDGKRASANNSWGVGETVEVYYDGTSYYANSVAGGSSDGIFDVSIKYPTSGVEGGNTYTLEGALLVLNTNLPSSKKKGGMSIKFIQTSDNKYVQYRLMSDSFNTTPSNWQGVDDEPTAGSDNLVKSGGVKNELASVYKKIGEYSGVYSNGAVIFTKTEVPAGNTISVKLILRTTAGSVRVFDAEGNVLKKFDVNGQSAGYEKVFEDYVLPNNYDYIQQIVNYSGSVGADIVVKTMSNANISTLALGAVYDVSAMNPTSGPNNDGKFESLSTLLSDANLSTLIPTFVRKGGMSIKFVQSSDNKYVEYFLTKDKWSSSKSDWQKINLEEEVNQLDQKQDAFLPATLLAINPSICVNSGFINENKTISSNLNYGYSNVIHILAGQRIRIQGVGTNMPYLAYCTSDGTVTGVSTNSSGITSVFENVFNEESYIRVNGRIVPDSNGNYVLGGIYASGMTLPELELYAKTFDLNIISTINANVKKYVFVRGAVYQFDSSTTVKVTLNTLFVEEYNGGTTTSISDSTEYVLGGGINNFLVLKENNTVALKPNSASILPTDYILLYYDINLHDITSGALYSNYLHTRISSVETRISSVKNTIGCVNVNHLYNHPAPYISRQDARLAVAPELRAIGLKLIYFVNENGSDVWRTEMNIGSSLSDAYWKAEIYWLSEMTYLRKYVSARGAVYTKFENKVEVTLNSLFVSDINRYSATSIQDTTTYSLNNVARFLVLQPDNTVTTRMNSAGLNTSDFVLLYYDDNASSKDIKGGALYADYLSSQLSIVSSELANVSSEVTAIQNEMGKTIPSDLGHINCMRKAYQMASFKWTPKVANTIPYNNGTFPASQQQGMIYSSAKEYSQFVFEDVSLETFMTAVNNPRSVLYTENVSAANSQSVLGRTYHGVNCAAYYGSVCSGLLTFAYGLPMNVTTYEFRNWDRMEVIQDQTPYGLEIGDAIWQSGHIQLVTGITKDKYGFITDIEIVENAAATTKIKHYTVDALQTYIEQYDCVLLRYKDLYANRSYTPLTQFVAVMDETQESYTYNNDICPNFGDKANYNEGDNVVLNLRSDYASAGFTTLEVYKGDVLLITRAISEQDETLSGLAYGDYKARLTGASNSEYCHFKVVNSVVAKNGDSFSFASANATPLYYEFCDLEGRRSYDIVGLSTHTFTSEELSLGSATPSGQIVSVGDYHYLKVHFQTDYGRIIKLIDWSL